MPASPASSQRDQPLLPLCASSELCWPQGFVPWVTEGTRPRLLHVVSQQKLWFIYIFVGSCVHFQELYFSFFFFFWLSDTCKVFFFIYVKIKYGFKAEWWSLFPQTQGWEGHSTIPWRFQQDPFMPLWLLIMH